MSGVQGKRFAIVLLIACTLAMILSASAGFAFGGGEGVCFYRPTPFSASAGKRVPQKVCTPPLIPDPNCVKNPDAC